MIVQFSVKNYKSFKDKCTFSMVASNYDKDTNESNNVIQLEQFNLRLLKSGVIYGANASGKSKFIDAIAFMKNFILDSSKERQAGDLIEFMTFQLSPETLAGATEFEISFIISNKLYRYGFEAEAFLITSEWLYSKADKPKSKEIELYYRDGQIVESHDKSLPKVKTLVKENLVRENALLLSVLAQFNDDIAKLILDYFSSFNTISGLNETEYKTNSISKITNIEQKTGVLEMLKSADFGIVDIDFEEQPGWLNRVPSNLQEHLKGKDLSAVRTKHQVFRENSFFSTIQFDMSKDESHGTQKFFYFSGLIIDALENGTALIVDELDSKLHPNLVCKIVSLFNSKESNPKNAQLIFNTHDTNLLSSGLFRRDQIWFISKDTYGASKMYSLADFKTSEVRKNEPFEDNYIKGKYGAVPYLGDFDELINKIVSEDDKAE